MKCPKHPEQTMRPLKYQKPNGKITGGGNRGTGWHPSGYYICESCRKPVEVKVTVEGEPIQKDALGYGLSAVPTRAEMRVSCLAQVVRIEKIAVGLPPKVPVLPTPDEFRAIDKAVAEMTTA